MFKSCLLSLLGLVAALHNSSAQNFVSTDAPAGPPPMPRRPSIILIVADGLGYGDLGCYGQQNVRTPNINDLAKEGVRFTSYYAASSRPAAARVSLLTGRDTGHLKLADDQNCTFPDGVPTVAELLQQAGYHTGCVGEWLLGETVNAPYKRGFQEWAGFLNTTDTRNDYPRYFSRFRAANEKRGDEEFNGVIDLDKNADGAKLISINELFGQSAGNFVTYNKPDKYNKRRPYFLYLPLTVPAVTNADSFASHSLDPWPKPERARADALVKLDLIVGRIIAKLRETQQETNTLVFLTSDTGARNENGSDVKFHKRAGRFQTDASGLGEGDLRAPLIVWGPGNVKAGEENFAAVSAYDLAPTFLEIARAKPAEDCDGLSLLPPLQGSPQPKRHEFLFWQTHPENAVAVRMGAWKAVRTNAAAPLKLLNPEVDAAEQTDFAKEKPDVVGKIQEYLRTR